MSRVNELELTLKRKGVAAALQARLVRKSVLRLRPRLIVLAALNTSLSLSLDGSTRSRYASSCRCACSAMRRMTSAGRSPKSEVVATSDEVEEEGEDMMYRSKEER